MSDLVPLPWASTTATGVGSMPGASPREGARVIAGEFGDLVHLAELPARGPGADMVGRTMALLHGVSNDLGAETTPDGWRLAGGDVRSMRRARSWLDEDLDALQECSGETRHPVKVQIVGPWTLAASVELASGERILRDPGACRELGHALAEAAALHVADIRRRMPQAPVILQLDEPGLPAVLAGRVGTASGLSSYRAVDEPVASAAIRGVLERARADSAGVHCCAERAPVALLQRAGAQFVSLDVLQAQDEDAIGAAWESGMGLLLGSVPAIGEGRLADARAAHPILALASRLGIADPTRIAQVVVTPTCGLAGASPDWTRTAMAACRAAARVLRDDEEQARRGEDEA